jgi:two-component system, chemotaxis family, chemotaxis protein CheY
MRMHALTDDIKAMMERIKVLIVDDEYYTRKVIRTLLLALGCTKIHEASDGASGLQATRSLAPDIVLLDWEMPGIDGAEFVRRVRSPEAFPLPNVPIIMLTGHGERSRVMEAVRLGVHEFLLKPVSSNALQARILSVLTKPRNMVRRVLRAGAAQACDLQARSRWLSARNRTLHIRDRCKAENCGQCRPEACLYDIRAISSGRARPCARRRGRACRTISSPSIKARPRPAPSCSMPR